MVPEEVADRFGRRSGIEDYGLLTATAQLYAGVGPVLFTSPGSVCCHRPRSIGGSETHAFAGA